MGGATFDDLKNHPDFRAFVEAFEKIYGEPLPEDIQRWLLDVATSSHVRATNTLTWIQRTSILFDNILSTKATDADYWSFWIHLYGIVSEFFEYESENRFINELVSFKRPILISLDSMRQKLSNDDLALIDFMRHSYSHIHLDRLWHKAKVKNEKIIIKPPYDPGSREIAHRIISEHNGDQRAMAYHYASVLGDDLNNLLRAVLEASAT